MFHSHQKVGHVDLPLPFSGALEEFPPRVRVTGWLWPGFINGSILSPVAAWSRPAWGQIFATGTPSAPCFRTNTFWASARARAFIVRSSPAKWNKYTNVPPCWD